MSSEVFNDVIELLQENKEKQARQARQEETAEIARRQQLQAEKAEEERVEAQNLQRLRESGILDIFEGLRDAHSVVWDDEIVRRRTKKSIWTNKVSEVVEVEEAVPAKIVTWGSVAEIRFDRRVYEKSDGNYDTYFSTSYSFIRAELDRDGQVCINDETVDSGSMAEAIAKAIIDPIRRSRRG